MQHCYTTLHHTTLHHTVSKCLIQHHIPHHTIASRCTECTLSRIVRDTGLMIHILQEDYYLNPPSCLSSLPSPSFLFSSLHFPSHPWFHLINQPISYCPQSPCQTCLWPILLSLIPDLLFLLQFTLSRILFFLSRSVLSFSIIFLLILFFHVDMKN